MQSRRASAIPIRGWRSSGRLPGEVSLQCPWDDLCGVPPLSLGLPKEKIRSSMIRRSRRITSLPMRSLKPHAGGAVGGAALFLTLLSIAVSDSIAQRLFLH